MKLKHIVFLTALLSASLRAAPIVQMHYEGAVSSPGFFLFTIDNLVRNTLCDQFSPGITTEPYLARAASLVDLTGTALVLAGDPNAFTKYQQVGMLALQAYLDPTNQQLAADVTWAMRYIVDGTGRLTNGAQGLVDWVRTQNPANYPQLANFTIFAPVVNDPNYPGYNLATQEQVGYLLSCTSCSTTDTSTPEPASFGLLGGGLVGIAYFALRRRGK